MRFFFDLSDGAALQRDEEGVEAPDLPQAIREAARAVEECRAEDELPGPASAWTLMIRDEAGAVVARLPLGP